MSNDRFIDDKGLPTPLGRERLQRTRDAINHALTGHYDNTGAPCRGNLGPSPDGHDSCYACNLAQKVLEQFADWNIEDLRSAGAVSRRPGLDRSWYP